VVDQRHRPREYAFVVESVVAVQRYVADLAHGRIVEHADERREDRLADLPFERGAFLVVVLAFAFETVAERLVEEHASRLGQKNGRTVEGIQHGGSAQALDLVGELGRCADQLGLVGHLGFAGTVEALEMVDQQAVLGTRRS
jgi:hypothetical protein